MKWDWFQKKRAETQEGKDQGSQEDRLKELLSLLDEKDFIKSSSFDMKGAHILEMAPRLRSLASMAKTEKGARRVVSLGNHVLSSLESLPFLPSSFEMGFLRLPFFKGGLNRLFREVVRVLKPGGIIGLSDFHPFSVRIQSEFLKNPVLEEGQIPGFERYFKIFHEHGLSLESVRESFIDGSMRKFFTTDTEQKTFDRLKKTPFAIHFWLKKEVS